MEDLFSLHHSTVFLRRDALDAGYRDSDLQQARVAGVVERIRHGAYVDAKVWGAASAERRHLLLADAVIQSHDSKLALSHTTAAIAHGMSMYQPDLSRIHVVCLDDSVGRTHADVAYHRTTPCDDDDLMVVDHRHIVPPTRAALEAALLTDVRHGLVVLDSALHLGLTTTDQLRRSYSAMEGNRGTRSLRLAVALARTGAESVGETLGRYLMWRHGIPEPELQREIRDSDGSLIARLDWTWNDLGLCGEFDGRSKYTQFLKADESVVDVVMREKAREDLVREITGMRMFRMVWQDLEPGAAERTAARIRRGFRQPDRIAG